MRGQILITGASGLLGSMLSKQAVEYAGSILSLYRSRKIDYDGVECVQLDLSDGKLNTALGHFNPSIIFHCAALADVDLCERDPELAWIQNVQNTEHVTQYASDVGAKMVHISTDAIFSGKDGMYRRSDPANPVNVYGETKLQAEQVVRGEADDHLIIRTNFFGANVTCGQSLAEWIIARLQQGSEVPAFEDAFFSPIYTGDLARILLEISKSDVTGTYHVCGPERVSKHEFANLLADEFGLDNDLINRSSIGEVDLDAERGQDLSLSVKGTKRALGVNFPSLEQGIARFSAESL